MRRKWEIGIGWGTALLATILFGGFSIVMGKISLATFESNLYPLLMEGNQNQQLQDSYNSMQVLGNWFAITVLAVIVFVVLADYLHTKKTRYVGAAVVYAVTGVILLLGTQFIGFPLAFCFFLSAGLCIVRNKRVSTT